MKALVKALALGAALAAGSAGAAPINVGGVVWDPDSIFDFSTTDAMIETIVNAIGETTSGYGKITSLNGELNNAIFCPGCELTYKFTGYKITDNTGGMFTFTGGTLDVYVDHTPNYNSNFASTASDGNLWLSLTGHVTYDIASNRVGTLHSDPTPASTGVAGDGRGFLDVTGGLAAGNFDTNTFVVQEDAAGTLGKADFQFTSSFQLLPNGATFLSDDGITYGLFGSNDLQGNSVPEPGSMALVALGLIGVGSILRRRK